MFSERFVKSGGGEIFTVPNFCCGVVAVGTGPVAEGVDIVGAVVVDVVDCGGAVVAVAGCGGAVVVVGCGGGVD